MKNIVEQIKSHCAIALLSLSLLGGAASSAKADVIEMSLLIDGSGAIGFTMFELQKQEYSDLFNDNFYSTYLNPGDQLYVSAYQFGTTVTQEVATTLINSDASAGAFGDLIGNLIWQAGWSNIPGAIQTGMDDLLNNGIDADRSVLHMLTRGVACLPTSSGGCPQAYNQFNTLLNINNIELTAVINPLGDTPITQYIDQASDNWDVWDVNAGPGAIQSVFANSLQRTSSQISEPSLLVLLLTGLGLMVLKRKPTTPVSQA